MNAKPGKASYQCTECGIELSYGKELSASYDNGARYPRAAHTFDRCATAVSTQNEWVERSGMQSAAKYNEAVVRRYVKFLLLDNTADTIFTINGPVSMAEKIQMKKTYLPTWFENFSNN